MRPVMRYHGGKWRVAAWVIAHFPPHEVYCEPFLGAGSVLLRKAPARVEAGGDVYGRVVNLFRVLREPAAAAELARRLRLTAYAETEYLAARGTDADPVEDARRMIVLGWQAHGTTGSSGGKLSGWRRGIRQRGPCSARQWADVWRHVEEWTDRLRGVYIEQGDAAAVMRRWDAPGTLHYLDPPYLASTRTTGACGYAHEMGEREHAALAARAREMRGMVVVSGYESALYRELYAGWRVERHAARADGGMARTECLWISPRADGALRRL